MKSDKLVIFIHFALQGSAALCELRGEHATCVGLQFAAYAVHALRESGSAAFAIAASAELLRTIRKRFDRNG